MPGWLFSLPRSPAPGNWCPQEDKNGRGYDFMIAIDLSTSMYAEDFQRGSRTTNRLQAIKPVIAAFINETPQRPHRHRGVWGAVPTHSLR